jgi:tetratricopeptide (TPR) repeat protein
VLQVGEDVQGLLPGAASQEIALAAAARLGDVSAQANAHLNIGRACFQLRETDGALHHFARALALRRQLGEAAGEAGAELDLCRVHEQRGDFDAALGCARRALGVYQSVSHRVGEAHAHNSVGWCLAGRGDYAEALEHCNRARIPTATSSGPRSPLPGEDQWPLFAVTRTG